MTRWQTQDELSWRPLAPFGVELDADLAAPLSAAAADRFAALFRQHALVIAPRQTLTMDRQRELLALLGPILIREGESGYLSNEGEHSVVRSGLAFHADAAYTEHPFDAIALHAMDVVDNASSTRFAHAEQALERLPADLRHRLSGLEAELITPGFELLAARVCDIPEPEFMKKGIRPAVLVNPNSGHPYLNLSEMHGARLLEMPWEASRDLLNQVFDYLYAPGNIYEHTWRRGDLVIWDNQALQHARGALEGVGKRVLQRVIVGTEGVAPHTIAGRSGQRDSA